jgi:hypothetical protein
MILDRRRRRIKLCFVIWQANRFANKCEKVCTSGIKKIQIINNSLEMIIIFSCVYKGIYLIISKILVMFLGFFFRIGLRRSPSSISNQQRTKQI